jgi:DNA-directed RNA polymerase subunit K
VFTVHAVKFKDLTKYEKARLIGARALQLATGAPCLIKGAPNTINSLELAKLEFDKNAIPLSVLR